MPILESKLNARAADFVANAQAMRALVDDQEMDSRASTGAIYWEGLCEVLDSNQRLVGRGYLEMTGYATPIRL